MLPVNDAKPTIQIGRRESIYKGSDTMWKLNPSDRTIATIALTKLLIKHAKLQTKETEIGA